MVFSVEPLPVRSASTLTRSNVGLHLPTGGHVLAADYDRSWWRDHGRSGVGDVVCLDCHAAGRPDVHLIYVHGTTRVTHLRHHSGEGEDVERVHSGETQWHVTAKARIADWANRQPGIADVSVETRLPSAGRHGRRPDVMAELGGRITAFEVQHSPLDPVVSDRRSRDLAEAGLNVVWLFHPGNEPRPDQVGMGMPATTLLLRLHDASADDEVGVLIRAGTERPTWKRHIEVGELDEFVSRPARRGETPTAVRWVPLAVCELTRDGIRLPADALADEGPSVDSFEPYAEGGKPVEPPPTADTFTRLVYVQRLARYNVARRGRD